MKAIKKTLILSSALLSFALANGVAAKDLKGWNIHVKGYPVSDGMERFLEIIEKKSNGKFKGKVYHAGVLGKQGDAVNQTRLGGIDFGVFSMGWMATPIPPVGVVSLPFIFKDEQHSYRAVDGKFGKMLAKEIRKKGLVAIGYYAGGSRSFYNSERPVNNVADLKGMKVRVMGNQIFVDMMSELGANASPMAFGEVYQSLKTGVIDGAENNWPSYHTTNHYQVAKYYSDSQHLIIPECLCVSEVTWNSLSDAEKKMWREAGQESAEYQRSMWDAYAEKSRQFVLSKGIKYNAIKNKQPFQDAMGPVYEKAIAKTPELKALIQAIKDTP